MSNFLIEDNERKRILKMHNSLKEQAQSSADQPEISDIDKLKYALNNCIKEYVWFIPDAQPLRKTKSGKDVIYGKGKSGAVFYFYPDLTFVNQSSGNKHKWICDFKPTPQPVKPVTFNSDQQDVLDRLKSENWFTEPKPTQVAIDNREVRVEDLTDPQSNLGRMYSKYFPKKDFPKGYLVYQKVEDSEDVEIDPIERDNPSGKQCRTSINNLYNNIIKPNQYKLTPKQEKDNVEIVRKCAENKRFLGIGGNKLEKVARRHGIEVR